MKKRCGYSIAVSPGHEMLILSSHNICFHGYKSKIFIRVLLLARAMDLCFRKSKLKSLVCPGRDSTSWKRVQYFQNPDYLLNFDH